MSINRIYKCLESVNSLYVNKTPKGYNAKPCCIWKESVPYYVETIEELLDNPFINDVKEKFKSDWRRQECNDCLVKEQAGQKSKRLRSLARQSDIRPGKIIKWDLRPDNTCNLKCAMCNPKNSIKWYEDIDIFTSFNYSLDQYENSRKGIDWNWIYDQCIDTAEIIYIAGGEPFYMKPVQHFLERLSQHEWNRNNTLIEIQTNAVSNTSTFIKTLSKFKNITFGISCDGWGSVNELIRFPTKHDVFVKNVNELMTLDTRWIFFSLTVQCMNLPIMDKTVAKIKEMWDGKYKNIDLHRLHTPKHLSINTLKPSIIEDVKRTTTVPEIKKFVELYNYDEGKNKKMKEYLLALDKARGTNSQKVIPWCFE